MKSTERRNRNRAIMMYTNTSARLEKTRFVHPSTFEKTALKTNLKQSLLNDINMFVRRKEYYKRVGKALKHGYLLFGRLGTGKSSLVGAIANYLNFDIYELQPTPVQDDACLRKLLLGIVTRTILLVEYIDRLNLLQITKDTDRLSEDEQVSLILPNETGFARYKFEP